MDNEAPETPEQTTEQPAAIVYADGSFAENWRESLPDGVKDFGPIKTVPDFNTLVQNYVGQEKVIGSYKRQIGLDKVAVPTEASGKEEWDAFYKAGGRPDKPEEYGLKRPDDFPEEMFSEDRAREAFSKMHELGISKRQAEGIWQWYHQNIAKDLQGAQQTQEMAAEEIKGKVLEEWGNAYEANVHIGNVGAAKAMDGQSEDYKERLLQKINADPDLIKYSYLLGKQFVESPGAPQVRTAQSTPEQIEEQITTLMQHPAFGEKMHPEHEIIMKKIQGLYKQKHNVR